MGLFLRAVFIAALWLSLSACNSPKTVENTCPECGNKPQSSDTQCSDSSVQMIPNQFVVTWETGEVTVEKSENVETFKKDLLEPRLEQIRFAEYNKIFKMSDENEVHTTGTPAPPNWGQDAIGLQSVWNQGVKGQGVLVAVVDTAVDYTHPNLKNRMVAGWDFVSNTAQAAAPHSHATHVSGIIGAEETNPVTVRGLAPQVKIMGVSFLGADGSGSLGDAISALKYSADHGARVINNSWGGGCSSQTLKDTMKAISDRGILLIVASGNEYSDLDTKPAYPAVYNFASQITVAASTINNVMADFANTSFSLVHLAAPGSDIYSTVPKGYGNLSGTSMATPFVTGAAALLLSARPTATALQVKQALMNSVDAGPYRVQSQGRLNVSRALDEIRRLVP